VRINIREKLGDHTSALGASVAEEHMAEVHSAIASGTLKPGTLVILNFEGVSAVNGSYVRSTALWLLVCGQLFNSNLGKTIVPRHQADARPYDVYVCVTGLSDEVRLEMQDFFHPRNLPLLYAKTMVENSILEAVLVGRVDPALQYTLNAVCDAKSISAPLLHSKYPQEHISVTAWNNRLNDLHGLRLVHRVRAGRTWEYKSLAKKMIWE